MQENAEKRQNITDEILNNVATLNVVLESNYINAKTTSIRDFINYSELAKKKNSKK